MVSGNPLGDGVSVEVLTRFLESAGVGFLKEALSRFPEQEKAGACYFDEAIDRFLEEQVAGAGFFKEKLTRFSGQPAGARFSEKPTESGFSEEALARFLDAARAYFFA
jgi:hypothetical protein